MGVDHGSAWMAGWALGLASALSIGPNNLLMIGEGLRGGRVITVPSVVLGCYCAAMAAAVAFAKAIAGLPASTRVGLCWAGVVALLLLAANAFRSSRGEGRRGGPETSGPEPLARCVARVLRVVCLNPLLYLEMVVAPATTCASFASEGDGSRLALGTLSVCAVYCFGYTSLARALNRLLPLARGHRLFDLASGLSLLAVAASTAHTLSVPSSVG